MTDYEKALATAWNVFWDKHFRGKEDTSIKASEVFDDAFLRGYRYGLETAEAQTESEPEHIPEATKKVDRTMIAAMAMQGILASEQYIRTLDYAITLSKKCGEAKEMTTLVAQEAVKYADALIAELKKEAE